MRSTERCRRGLGVVCGEERSRARRGEEKNRKGGGACRRAWGMGGCAPDATARKREEEGE